MLRRPATVLVVLLALAASVASAQQSARQWIPIAGGNFQSSLQYEDSSQVRIRPFELMRTPVTNEQFLTFVRANPQWQRGKAPRVFSETRYLSHWDGPLALGANAQPQQPVVNVSWFAADAYCQAQGARLPSWNEWEYVAAADERRRDARSDRVWRERILAWYSRPSNHALPRAGLQAPNIWGVQDIHGLVWEWTDDYNALLVDADNRRQGDADTMRFCGAGALSMRDRNNYAVMMRVAMLSSMQGNSVTANMGFRCAR